MDGSTQRITIVVKDNAMSIEMEGMKTYESIGILEAAKFVIIQGASTQKESDPEAQDTGIIVQE